LEKVGLKRGDLWVTSKLWNDRWVGFFFCFFVMETGCSEASWEEVGLERSLANVVI